MNTAEEDIKKNELESIKEDLENEKKFLNSLFDSMMDLVIVIDKNFNIIRANVSFLKFTNNTPESVRKKKCFEVFRGTELVTAFESYTDFFETVDFTRQPHSKLLTINETENITWEMIITPILNNNTSVDFYLITWHKISDKNILRKKVESAEQTLRNFVNSAQDWISIKDKTGRYIIVNEITAKAFGLNPIDFIGRFPEEILNKDVVKTIKTNEQIVFDTGETQTFQEKLVLDGEPHHIQMVRFLLYDWKGEVNGICTIGRDITKEIKLQEQLIHSEKLAALGKLAAGVAHEINNPLTGILANAEYIKDSIDSSHELQDDIKIIINEVLRSRDIVNLLLDYTRQDSPKLKDISLNQIITNSLSLLSRLPQFRNINIETQINEQLPLVLADEKQIQQVLLNLLINAADSLGNKGNIKLITAFSKTDHSCKIIVVDEGKGIPENVIEKIFEPFFSTKNTSGLGLAVSKGIIERHKGTLTASNNSFGGASFEISLPTKLLML